MTTKIHKPLGILGGSFDPIHDGHLRIALEVQQQLAIEEIAFLPTRQQTLKSIPHADAGHRLRMLQLALHGEDRFSIDTREMLRDSPSYTIDTLISLRQEFPARHLCLILGDDSFATLPEWHRWQELFDYAHFIVIKRDNFSSQQFKFLEKRRIIEQLDKMWTKPVGFVYFFAPPVLPVSATFIRSQLQQKLSPRFLLPEAVLHYIYQHALYQPGD